MAGIRHGIATAEQIPPAARTEQAAWDEVISGIWRSVLAPFCNPNSQTAIEVGPGTSAKVALALGALEFRGRVFLVDPAANALEVTGEKYRACCPDAEITCLQATLEEALEHLPQRPDFLLLSHVIDDLMLHDAARALPANLNPFEWCAGRAYRLKPTQDFHAGVSAIEQDRAALDASKTRTLALLGRMMAALRPKLLAVSQYPSATLTENGLDSMNVHTDEVFQAFARNLRQGPGRLWKTPEIQLLLDRNTHYNHEHIGNNILNAANWLIYEDKNEENGAKDETGAPGQARR
jgi:hypothetical protein